MPPNRSKGGKGTEATGPREEEEVPEGRACFPAPVVITAVLSVQATRLQGKPSHMKTLS